MTFMKEILNHNIPIWNECADTKFIRELQAGTLSFEKFKCYMIQDSIYLKYYARVYGKAMYCSTTLKDIQFYYSILSFLTETESAVRLKYLKQFGITDDDIELIQPLPKNQKYIGFMLEIAAQGNTCEMLMVGLPCLLSYSYIFRKITANLKTTNSRYWDLIQDYSDEHYFEKCKYWCDFTDKMCEHLCNNEKEHLRDIFEKASRFELDFWKMVYHE